MKSIRLICTEGRSNKFWEAKVENCNFIVSYGSIGSKPQTSLKEFNSDDEAHEYMETMVRSKVKKGYRIDGQVTPKSKVQLEKEFTKLCETIGQDIKSKFDAIHNLKIEYDQKAEALKQEAIQLADKHGIPFNISCNIDGSHEDGTYLPESFFDNYANLDSSFVYKIAGINEYYNLDEDMIGWQSSSC